MAERTVRPLTKGEKRIVTKLCEHLKIPIDPNDDSKTVFRIAVLYERFISTKSKKERVDQDLLGGICDRGYISDIFDAVLLKYTNSIGNAMYYILNHDKLKNLNSIHEVPAALKKIPTSVLYKNTDISKSSVHSAYNNFISKDKQWYSDIDERNKARINLNMLYGDDDYQLRVFKFNNKPNTDKEQIAMSDDTVKYSSNDINKAIKYLKNIHILKSTVEDIDFNDINAVNNIKAYRINNGLSQEKFANILEVSRRTYSDFESLNYTTIRQNIKIIKDLYNEGILADYIPLTPSITCLIDHCCTIEEFNSAKAKEEPEEEIKDVSPEEFKDLLEKHKKIKKVLEENFKESSIDDPKEEDPMDIFGFDPTKSISSQSDNNTTDIEQAEVSDDKRYDITIKFDTSNEEHVKEIVNAVNEIISNSEESFKKVDEPIVIPDGPKINIVDSDNLDDIRKSIKHEEVINTIINHAHESVLGHLNHLRDLDIEKSIDIKEDDDIKYFTSDQKVRNVQYASSQYSENKGDVNMDNNKEMCRVGYRNINRPSFNPQGFDPSYSDKRPISEIVIERLKSSIKQLIENMGFSKRNTLVTLELPKEFMLKLIDEVVIKKDYNRAINTIDFIDTYFEILISSEPSKVVSAIENLDSRFLY